LLRDAGAEIEVVSADAATLPFDDASFDVALRLTGMLSGEALRAWAHELRRLLRPQGICALRVPALRDPEGAEGGFTGVSLEAALRGVFPIVDVLGEKAFLGVALSAAGADNVALNEALQSTLDGPGHFIALCTAAEARPWSVTEALLVPVGPAEVRGAVALEVPSDVVVAEDPTPAASEVPPEDAVPPELRRLRADLAGLREALMAAEDQLDRRDATLAALRRESERHLSQITGTAQELEAALLERDRAVRRLAQVEAEAAELSVALRRREVEVASAEREIAHLRARGLRS
jgi:SAM-dependent methyltransferase